MDNYKRRHSQSAGINRGPSRSNSLSYHSTENEAKYRNLEESD